MITAVDSSVLLDVFGGDSEFGIASREALREYRRLGGLVACDVVWAEVSAAFGAAAKAQDALRALGIEFDPLGEESAVLAGMAWSEYRKRGGARQRVVPGFLIGAHAQVTGVGLLTRDRGFYRSYFADLEVIDPTAN